jgi:hypothetical protein
MLHFIENLQAKYDELVHRDQEMQSFFQQYDSSTVSAVERKMKLDDEILSLLNIIKYLDSVCYEVNNTKTDDANLGVLLKGIDNLVSQG